MNLPLINNDTVGNSYYGWRSNNLVYSPESVGFTSDKWQSWINGFFKQTCVDEQFRLILPASFETLSLPVSSSKWRFSDNGGINSANATGIFSINMLINGGGQNLSGALVIGSTTRVHYAVLNNKSLAIFSTERKGAELDTRNASFASIGWLSNPLYSGDAFPRNAYYFFCQNANNNQGLGSGCISAENTTVTRRLQFPDFDIFDSIANYSIACQTATPGANATELYLRENVAPYKARGYVPNLLKTSLEIPIGGIYRNTGIDPDASTVNTWMCVGKFGTERLLMRVWTQGLA